MNDIAMRPPLFLTPEETDELTGILTGKRVAGQSMTKLQLQVAWLRRVGIPFTENARGRPIIARAAIEGRLSQPAPLPERRGWTPHVLAAAA